MKYKNLQKLEQFMFSGDNKKSNFILMTNGK